MYTTVGNINKFCIRAAYCSTVNSECVRRQLKLSIALIDTDFVLSEAGTGFL